MKRVSFLHASWFSLSALHRTSRQQSRTPATGYERDEVETLQQVSKVPFALTPVTALTLANFGVTGRSTSPLMAKANCPLVQHLQDLWQANMYCSDLPAPGNTSAWSKMCWLDFGHQRSRSVWSHICPILVNTSAGTPRGYFFKQISTQTQRWTDSILSGHRSRSLFPLQHTV